MHKKWRLIAGSLILAGAIVVLGILKTSSVPVQAQQTSPSLAFSPDTVKNGQTFTIAATGPANSTTHLYIDSWLDNNTDTGNFTDFGTWVNIDANGKLNQSRTLTCSSYNSYIKGQNYDLTGHALHQRVYIIYGDGTRSPEATQTKDCTTTSMSPPSSQSGGESCDFTQPSRNAQIDGNNVTVKTDISIPSGGWPTGETPETPETFNLAWIAVDSNRQPLKDTDGYTATLSSPGLNGSNGYGSYTPGLYAISSSSVSLSGSKQATTGGKYDRTVVAEIYTTYNLSIKKNGSEVTSCLIKLKHYFNLVPQISGETTQLAGSFPADGSYTLPGTGSNTFQTIYAFSDPLIGPTLEAEDSFTQIGWTPVNAVIGQFHKGLFMNRVAFKGPVARWDISDPLHPKNPFKMDAIGLNDQSAGNGPLPARMWGHEGDMGQVLYAENADGDGRIHIDLANNFSSAMDVAAAIIDGSGKLSMGEKYSDIYSGYEKDGKWIPGIGILSAPGVVVATPAGKYFSYFTGPNNTKIFDITDLSGVVHPSPSPNGTYCYGPDSGCLEHLTTVAWPNISEWTVVQAPGSDTQYLIGKSNSNILSTTPEKATVRIAQIDSDTGKLLNPKSQTFTGVANLSPSIHLFDNMQPAYVNGKIYILAFEGYFPNSDYVKGQVKIGIYSFNTTNLSLTRTGEILFHNIIGTYTKMSHMLSVVNSEDGSGYPLLEVAMAGGAAGSNGFQLNGDDTFNFYSLKDLLGKNSVDPTPAFVMHPVPHKMRLIEGDVLVNQWPQNNNAFLKSENGKMNLYIYRVASIIEGTRTYTTYDYPYKFVTFQAADPAYKPPTAAERVDIVKTLAGVDKGDMGFRVDRIDVTSLTGGATTPIIPTIPTTPTNTGNPSPSTIGSGGDCYSKYKGNTQLVDLCQQIESLKQQVCKMSPTISFCSSPQAQ